MSESSHQTTKTKTNYSNQHVTASTAVTVPPRYIGSVIGKEGKTIQEIKEKTHTRITHLYPNPHEGHLLDCFRITGSPHNVDQAQKWIRRVVANTWRKDNPNETQSTEDESTEKKRAERPEPVYYESLFASS